MFIARGPPFRKTTPDPHILAHVNIEVSDEKASLDTRNTIWETLC